MSDDFWKSLTAGERYQANQELGRRFWGKVLQAIAVLFIIGVVLVVLAQLYIGKTGIAI